MPRDLDADLAICEAATPGPWIPNKSTVISKNIMFFFACSSRPNDAEFIAAARTGWPETIRELQAAESEIDRLQNELNIMQEQLQNAGRCWD